MSTLFAVGFLIGQGGDGCSSSSMSRISGDARRLFDPNLSSPFGLSMRNLGGSATAQYDPTGRGADPNAAPPTPTSLFERVYIRVRKYPTSGSPDAIIWALNGSIEGSPALCLRISTTGTVTLHNQGNAAAPGSSSASMSVALDVWYCMEFYALFNTQTSPNNSAVVKWRIDYTTEITNVRSAVSPVYGVDKKDQKASSSQLGDSSNAGKGLDIDYADWISDDGAYVGLSRRVAVMRAAALGTYTSWAGGNSDYRQQLDFPFPSSGVTLEVIS